MNYEKNNIKNYSRPSNLKEQRLQELVDNCQREVLTQIIGPFGLTPAMFQDKDGGNVATVFNAEKGVFPDEKNEKNFGTVKEKYSQKKRADFDDTGARGRIHKNNNEQLDAGGTVLSDATGRPMEKGKINGDHTVSIKEFDGDKDAALRFTVEERKQMINDESNMSFIEESINKSKGEHSWSECLSKPGFQEKHNLSKDNIEKMKKNDKKARKFIQKEKNKRLADEVLTAGAKEGGKNALRQAMGVLLYEFVNGSFIEIKAIVRGKQSEKNCIDELIESLKRVMNRVISKLKHAFDAAIQGGVQGFVSNLLTFLINNLITTAKKFVTIIREGMQGLWRAIKLMFNPPKDMTAIEIAREVTKIISGVVTIGLGLLLEESVKGFILSVPIFVPFAEVLAAALTAITTGVVGALVVYGLDQMFDWLSSTGTELLEAYENNIESQMFVVSRLQNYLSLQFENSRLYDTCELEYRKLQETYTNVAFQLDVTEIEGSRAINNRESIKDAFETQTNHWEQINAILTKK